jgi:hypothetical protein
MVVSDQTAPDRLSGNKIGDKMFIETRTTHTEVLADVLREVEHKANSVVNTVVAFKHHPTYNTKTGIRQELWQLQGMAQLARQVTGKALPESVQRKLDDAVDAVESL